MRLPDWLGFRGKTLWDWLQLLIVPAILIGVTFAWSATQTRSDNRREDRRIAADRAAAEEARQDATLQGYLDQMSGLMLDKKLLTSKAGRCGQGGRAYRHPHHASPLGRRAKGRGRTLLVRGRAPGRPDSPCPGGSRRAPGAESTTVGAWSGCRASGDLAGADLGDANLTRRRPLGRRPHGRQPRGRRPRKPTSRSADLGAPTSRAPTSWARTSGAPTSWAPTSRAPTSRAPTSGRRPHAAPTSAAPTSSERRPQGRRPRGRRPQGRRPQGAVPQGRPDSRRRTLPDGLDLGRYITDLPPKRQKAFLASQKAFLDSLTREELSELHLSPEKLAKLRREASGG